MIMSAVRIVAAIGVSLALIGFGIILLFTQKD
jgi:hypothetical protein